MKTFQWIRRISFVFLGSLLIVGTANADLPRKKCMRGQFEGIKGIFGIATRVVDGDTFEAQYKDGLYHFRVLSIDTPETHYLGRSQGPWADKAKETLERLIQPQDKLKIMFDQIPCDSYGRILGLVWNKELFVNAKMLAEGLAVNYCIFPNIAQCNSFGNLTRQSMEEQRGFFSDPTVELPYLWRANLRGGPDKYVGNLKTKKVYLPTSYKKIPVPLRVFFMKKSDIRPPFELIEGQNAPHINQQEVD